MEHTIGWLIDKVMNGLGIQHLIDTVVGEIEKALGIDQMKDDLRKMIGSALQPAKDALSGLMDDAGATSIVSTVMNVSTPVMHSQDPAF